MSHYCVAVFSHDPDDYSFDQLLAPYQEKEGNPDSKWDWYTLDGRESDFDAKRGQKWDEHWCRFRKNQIKFKTKPTKAEYQAALKFWKENIEPEDGKGDGFFSRVYYLDHYKDAEDYASTSDIVTPYAFVTPNGEWHAPGDVGWFALDDSTPESNAAYQKEWFAYLDSDDNPYVSFVDCHI